MKSHEQANFTVVGGGLAGALMALYLARRGQLVDLYEKRPDMRTAPVERGRSINLAVSLRGLAALAEVGLDKRILDMAIPMPGRMIHDSQGCQRFQRYSIHPGEAIYSVSRGELNKALLTACDDSGLVRTHFNWRCTGLDAQTGAIAFSDEKGEERVVANGPAIAADGAFSAVRASLQRHDRFDYHQDYLDWGYKELTMPALPGGRWAMPKNALHIWPRHDFMLIALPNLDGSFTCTVFLPFEGPNGFAALHSDEPVM
ncbi:MAG: FAD-dependent monooxygenase, partial [Cyanobacteria bacterium REEB65]|nr:FAD-dependent monooxygenase [Cyanobacteria bacterium REEB65]